MYSIIKNDGQKKLINAFPRGLDLSFTYFVKKAYHRLIHQCIEAVRKNTKLGHEVLFPADPSLFSNT